MHCHFHIHSPIVETRTIVKYAVAGELCAKEELTNVLLHVCCMQIALNYSSMHHRVCLCCCCCIWNHNYSAILMQRCVSVHQYVCIAVGAANIRTLLLLSFMSETDFSLITNARIWLICTLEYGKLVCVVYMHMYCCIGICPGWNAASSLQLSAVNTIIKQYMRHTHILQKQLGKSSLRGLYVDPYSWRYIYKNDIFTNVHMYVRMEFLSIISLIFITPSSVLSMTSATCFVHFAPPTSQS